MVKYNKLTKWFCYRLDSLVAGLPVYASHLQDGEEGLEGHAVRLLHQAPDVGLRRVLAEGAKHLADLVRLEQKMKCPMISQRYISFS